MTCSRCHRPDLTADDFYVRRYSHSGETRYNCQPGRTQPWCKLCRAEYSRERRKDPRKAKHDRRVNCAYRRAIRIWSQRYPELLEPSGPGPCPTPKGDPLLPPVRSPHGPGFSL